MILYLDASALVKSYVEESGSADTLTLINHADISGTAIVTRAEVAAGLAKARRRGSLSQKEADEAIALFHQEWPQLVHVMASEVVVARADSLAWEYNLRGYDAVHLASALVWQETLASLITLATFDKALWKTAKAVNIDVWPKNLQEMLA